MRKLYTAIVIASTICLYSCEKKAEKKIESEQYDATTNEEETDLVDGIISKSNVYWTAYKATEKIPVNGYFDVVLVKNINKEGKTVEEVLDGANIIADLTTIDSEMAERDQKLRNILFGNIVSGKEVLGNLNFKNGKTFLKLTLNNISKEYEVKSLFENNVFTIELDLDLMDFNMSKSFNALNKACLELHKGSDGVSKTWSEVHIKGQIEFVKNFSK